MEIVLIDTKSPKVRIEILMTGSKIAACNQKMADSDDMAVCSKLVLNWKIRRFVKDWCVRLNHFELIYEK